MLGFGGQLVGGLVPDPAQPLWLFAGMTENIRGLDAMGATAAKGERLTDKMRSFVGGEI